MAIFTNQNLPLNNITTLANATCSFSSSLTIYETQYKCTIRENEFNFSGFIKSILDEFNYKNDVEYYIREYGDRDASKELIKLKHLERYVDSLLR